MNNHSCCFQRQIGVFEPHKCKICCLCGRNFTSEFSIEQTVNSVQIKFAKTIVEMQDEAFRRGIQLCLGIIENHMDLAESSAVAIQIRKDILQKLGKMECIKMGIKVPRE